MSKLKSIFATPLGVLNQTQQHFNKQQRAPIGASNSVNLFNFNQSIHNGQEKQYSIESELCKGFDN